MSGLQNAETLSVKFGRVAVLMGGTSAEREISLISGKAVLTSLLEAGVDAFAFDPAEQAIWTLPATGANRVFAILHGRQGEDGTIQAALELMNMPYTGSGVLASALAMDKLRSRRLWQAAGLPVPQTEVLVATSDFSAVADRLGLPLFVKPANEGSSIGISKVKALADLPVAQALAARYDDCVLAERFLDGGEFTVGILGEQALPVIRIVPATEFYDYEAKYFRDDTRYLIPSGLDLATQARMREMALDAFRALGGRGWGRVDFMTDKAGNIYCLEANTAPGMTGHSLVPIAARAVGLDFTALVLAILAETIDG